MIAYLAKVQDLLSNFETRQITQIPKTQNFEVDSLAKLASVPSFDLSRIIPVECLGASNIQDKELLPLTMDPYHPILE